MVPVTDDITSPPPLDRKESSVQDDGTAPHERLEDASSLRDVDQDLPELSVDQVSSGERRHLTAEEIFNQPEVPIEVPGAGTSIRPFIRHNESADVFQDALDDGLSDREFAVRALGRLTTNPQLTPDEVAAWPDELIVAAIRLLVASDEYLAPPEGEEVTIESFREAGCREATEDERRWDELAKRVTAFYPGAHIAKQIAELNVAEKFAKLAQPDYNAISGFLTAASGVQEATKALREMSGAERILAQANSINDTIGRIGTIDPDLLRVQNPIADTIRRIGEMNPAAETIRRAWVGNSAADIVGDALREREARMAHLPRDSYMPPTVFPMPPRSHPRPVLPAEVEHEAKEDDAQAPASAPVTAATPPADPVAMIEEVSIKYLVLAVGELKTEVSKVTTAIIDGRKGQGTDWTKVGGIVAMIGLPFVVLGAYFAWLTLKQSSGAGPAVSPTPSALASSALPSPVPSPTQSPSPSPIVPPTASPTPATSPRASTGGAASQVFVSSLLRVVLIEPPRYTRWSPPSYPRGPAIAGGDLRMASLATRHLPPSDGPSRYGLTLLEGAAAEGAELDVGDGLGANVGVGVPVGDGATGDGFTMGAGVDGAAAPKGWRMPDA